jgi:hypothetical protein
MIDDTMLKAAEAEVVRLEEELKKTPAYKRLQAAKNLIAVYRADPETVTPAAATQQPTPRYRPRVPLNDEVPPEESEIVPATKTALVDAAVAEYLTRRGRRATSGELLPVVQAKGIVITGQVPAKTLSSFLSRSKRFDNVQGFGGFGLVEWNGRRTAPTVATADPQPGPDSSPASATKGGLFN